MLSLFGGIILVGLFVFILYVFAAPVFEKIGSYVISKLKPFKKQEENK